MIRGVPVADSPGGSAAFVKFQRRQLTPRSSCCRARHVTDPDLDGPAASPADKRICGVPESIYNALTDAEREKVLAGRVIRAAAVAPRRWPAGLARHEFQRSPAAAGQRGKRPGTDCGCAS